MKERLEKALKIEHILNPDKMTKFRTYIIFICIILVSSIISHFMKVKIENNISESAKALSKTIQKDECLKSKSKND